MADGHDTDTHLKQSITLPLLVLFGLGTIIGAGVYVLIGEVAAIAGMASPLAFTLAAFLAGFTAFSFAELSSRFPKSAGEAVYVREGIMRPVLPIVVGVMVCCVGMVSAATISNGFVGYLNEFVDVPAWLAITCLLVFLGALAIWGITESVLLLSFITLIEVVGLLMIIVAGAENVSALPARWTEVVPLETPTLWVGVLGAAFLAFYAFIGFEDMVNVAEEVKDVRRTLPQAIILTLILSTALYVAVSLVAVFSLPIEDLAGAEAPLALIYERATGRSAVLISAISLFAVINGALVQIIMASRILYGLRNEWFVFQPFGNIHPKTQTPILATLLITGLTWLLATSFSLTKLAETTSAITLAIFALVNLALLRLKRQSPPPDGIYTVSMAIPVIGFLVSIGFLIFYFI